MVEYNSVGRSLPRLDSRQKATGECRFTGDRHLPRLLHGRILRSTLPHARILHVDTGKASRLPGVKAVVTGKDTAGIGYGLVSEYRDKVPLAIEKVRYIGDDIAAVAAVDEDTAEEALRLISVELEELPAVFDPEEAMKPGAPRIHDHVERNISRRALADLGPVEESFKVAYHVREDTFTTPTVSHAPLETHVSVAQWDRSGGLTVWTSTQTPFYVQEDLASTLQLPRSSVRVIKPPVGGAFGGKSAMEPPDFCAALLSTKTGCPVRIVYGREEEFLATRQRHATVISLRTAVDKDGISLARDCRLVLDGGAYINLGAVAPLFGTIRLSLPYRQKALRYEGLRVYTNKPPGGAMRGYMAPQVHFAQEMQMDLLAGDLGLDPVEIRLRNAVQPGDVTLSSLSIVSCAFSEGLRAVATRARPGAAKEAVEPDRRAFPGPPAPSTTGAGPGKGQLSGWSPASSATCKGPLEAQGFGCSGFPSGNARRARPGNEALSSAAVVAQQDGFFTLFTGIADVGQGAETTLCQIAAQALGVPFEKVRIVAADTSLTPPDMGSFSSRVTTMAGNAALAAAAEVARQLREAAAQQLEANPDDLELARGRIFVKGSPDRALTLVQAIASCQAAREGALVTGQGVFTTQAHDSPTFSFGSQLADVTVDPETGQVEVSRVVCSHDCGVAINPMSVEGQLEGSVHMGLGFALSEKAEIEGGVFLNPSFLDYKVPTALDMPQVEVLFTEVPDPVGPFGAKEAGEGTVGPTAPAIVSAVANAIGKWLKSLPITPEDVKRELDAATDRRIDN